MFLKEKEIVSLSKNKETVAMDEKWFKRINRLSGRYSPADAFMIAIANKARYVYLFILICLWFYNRSSRQKVIEAGWAAGLSFIANYLIKLVYDRPRPFIKRRVGILIPSKMDSSFPSQHTLLAFAVSTPVLLYERTVGALLGTLAVMTGFSRIWTGHHYPSDIIGSAFIGSFFGLLAVKFHHVFDSLGCYCTSLVLDKVKRRSADM
jgi:undecaprenyl-diphosphatase